jgi:anti-sigma factor RsiW
MTQINFDEQACRTARSRLDSYLDNELLAESNLDLLEHFRQCAACTQEAEARRTVRVRLQAAVRETTIPGGLEARVRERLREAQRPPARKLHLMAIAAALLVCFGSGLAYWLRTEAAREAHIAAMLRIGLGDHIHCAIGRQLTRPHSGGVNKLQGEFQDLTATLHEHVPADLPFSVAHECTYQGRKYIHLTYRDDRTVLSLVIARKQKGEALTPGTHTLRESGYQVAAFESGGFLVYTVSDLPQQKNLEVLAGMEPAIRGFLPRAHAENQAGG